MTLLYKAVQAQLKALDDKGQGQAVIATLGVVDHDDDVTEAGAFGEQWVKMVPAHNWAHAPIGKARLHESGNEVIADFQMNLRMDSAKEWYEALKFDLEQPPALQEWSYGFRILDSGFGEFELRQVRFLKRLKAIEISPVMIGAGMNTRTLTLKSLLLDEEKQEGFEIQTVVFPKRAWDSAEACRRWLREHDFSAATLDETESSYRFRQAPPDAFSRLRTICLAPSRDTPADECRIQAVGGPRKGVEPDTELSLVSLHTTETSAASWDMILHDRRVKSAASEVYFRRLYAARERESPPDIKASWHMLHHEVEADGTPGPANLRACLVGIAGLNRGVKLADAERQAIYAHLSAHLTDADREPPELRGLEEAGLKLDEEADLVLWELEAFLCRVRDVKEIRALKLGKDLQDGRLTQLGLLKGMLETLELRLKGAESLKPEAVQDVLQRFDALKAAL